MSNNISRGEVSSAVSSAEQTNAQSGPADNLIEYYGWNIFSYLKDKWNQVFIYLFNDLLTCDCDLKYIKLYVTVEKKPAK